MKTFLGFFLLAIALFACTKQNESSASNDEVEVVVYATHAADTTKITSSDPVRMKLK